LKEEINQIKTGGDSSSKLIHERDLLQQRVQKLMQEKKKNVKQKLIMAKRYFKKLVTN